MVMQMQEHRGSPRCVNGAWKCDFIGCGRAWDRDVDFPDNLFANGQRCMHLGFFIHRRQCHMIEDYLQQVAFVHVLKIGLAHIQL